MRGIALGGVLAVTFIVVAAQARGGDSMSSDRAPANQEPAADWGAWTRPLSPGAATLPSARTVAQLEAEPEIDVVDARWMAMTMWGEARGGGEEGMRAVGHVIDNRTRAGLGTRYVTDTVSEAFQFSCWNRGDPNREAMMNVDLLRPGDGDHAMWLLARRLAEEVLAGRSQDPTGGALFYHSISVAPRWSAGIAPTTQIGSHLFFRRAR
jgi:spore germination cell wall hydrolase CwlJ-like protein